ncbi:putative disease resistance RPP13-like protein 1 isoform X1 [Quercus robur]|uniref:putative disease resistance RPP13-like protein 1 isoform X1 n=1 Tax=Quercus robur TaxID=38942 RepID=UPI00216262F6|nr:putative disease resistance RPP13-like protein 1 isoform X1 [Quercus robur]
MGEALLGSAMEVVLERLQGQDLNELLKKLKIALLSVNSVVGDAEKKQYHNPAVKMWLDDFKDAFYHVEDLMDDILTEDLQQSLDHWQRIRKTDIERKTGEILMKIEYVAKQKDVLGLRETIVGYDMKSSLSMPATSFVDPAGVFGRDLDKREIIVHTLSLVRDRNLGVIAIVGMGGIGKTTLAQLVYNDIEVTSYFDMKAWACISDNFDTLKVTKTILDSITSQRSDFSELNLLLSKLEVTLRGRRFLLVLDDVWNVQYKDWEVFLSLLEVVSVGSCIIVTTRIQRVAEMMNADRVHHLKELSISESRSLFRRISFGDKDPISYPRLKAIGNEIVKKCHGLPLAIKSVAASLRFKLQVREWNNVLEGLTNFPTGMGDVFNVLRQSYDHLPAHLKRCFGYCSIIPKGYEFEKEKLILLWMAEGLLQQPRGNPRGNHRMEDLGEEYFHELLSMSLFQPSSGNKSRFRMHDLISDLAIYVSGKFSFRLENDDPTDLTASIRYLSLFRCRYDSPEIFEGIRKARYIRTFLPLNHELCHLSSNELQKLLFELQFLRVLSLCCYHIDELPDSIGNLKHLRYIDLSYAAIKRLPKSVCALCNLQSLILFYCCSLTELPENMWQLVNLRHLDITGTALKEIPREICELKNLQKLILANCHSLTELPEGMWQLSNLSHLDITGTALQGMPKEISKLQNLQTLPYFVVGKNTGSTVKELGGLLYLHGTLHISKLHNVVSTDDAVEASLAGKTYLDELTLEWGDKTVDSENDRKVLEALQPHVNLKMLRIKFYSGTEFPFWLGDLSFSKMQFLCLSNCEKCLCLPPLGQLPSLKVLIIEGMAAVKRVGPEFCGMHMPFFQSLETLTFEGMLEWEEWVSCEVDKREFPRLQVDEREFPRLQVLSIRRCPKLKGQLPKQLPSVVKVEISESQELMTALTMEASSQEILLRYHDKVLFMSEDKVVTSSEQHTDFNYEGAVESSLLSTQAAPKRPLHIYDRVLSTTGDGVASFSEDITVSSSVSKKVSEISELKNLPENLHSLKIEGCDAEFISEAVGIYSLPILQHIYIINCCSLKSFPGGCPPSAMRSLYIQNCKKLEFLPPAEMMHQYAGLQHLCIGSSCDSMISFPLGFFSNLRSLSIWDCGNLESLSMPEGIQKDLRALEALEIRACPKLVSFPGELPAPNLKSIWFSNCKNLKKLPDQFHTLNSLQSLFINDCPELVSLSEGGLPSELILLSVTSCNKLILGLEWGLYKLHHLCELEIEGGCGNVVSFPEEKLLPGNLNSLRISELLNLENLNKGLLHLTALKTLEISCCNKLQSLPEEGLPSSLSFLCIKECSLLNAKLQNKAGKDWSKIAHISRIEID